MTQDEKNKLFDDWFHGFGSSIYLFRSENFYSDILIFKNRPNFEDILLDWLKDAFHSGAQSQLHQTTQLLQEFSTNMSGVGEQVKLELVRSIGPKANDLYTYTELVDSVVESLNIHFQEPK
jgi:hypothetical protein